MKNNREGVSRTTVCADASMGGGLFAWLIDWDIFALIALFSVCFALGVRYVWHGIEGFYWTVRYNVIPETKNSGSGEVYMYR